MYETIDKLQWTRLNGAQSMALMVWWGGVCGVFGATVGCPLYMVKTQMQAQSHGKFAVGFQHNHTGMVNALITIYKSHGTGGLWRGCQGIVPRTAVGSAIQISTFMTCKDFLQQYDVCLLSNLLCIFSIPWPI